MRMWWSMQMPGTLVQQAKQSDLSAIGSGINVRQYTQQCCLYGMPTLIRQLQPWRDVVGLPWHEFVGLEVLDKLFSNDPVDNLRHNYMIWKLKPSYFLLLPVDCNVHWRFGIVFLECCFHHFCGTHKRISICKTADWSVWNVCWSWWNYRFVHLFFWLYADMILHCFFS